MQWDSTGLDLSKFFGTRSKNVVLAWAVGVVLFIGMLDYIFPYEFSMSIFYVAPILFAAWFADKKHADLVCIIALIVTWWTDELTADLYHLGWIHTYKMGVRLFFFLAISMGASGLRARRDMSIAQIEMDRKQIDLLERTQSLEREIIKISEREQQRIGQDLHDGLCQYLAAIACAATSLKNDLQKQSLTHETASAAEIAELLKQGVTQARNVARGLSPVYADESGLDSALQELASHTTHMLNIECEFESTRVAIHDNAIAGHLYRIAQESLHNATRHGLATRVVIALSDEDGLVTMRITDNGMGVPFSFTDSKSGGMGLRVMDYRARLIGGNLEVCGSREGASGVVVTCTFRQSPAAGSLAASGTPLPAEPVPLYIPERDLVSAVGA